MKLPNSTVNESGSTSLIVSRYAPSSSPLNSISLGGESTNVKRAGLLLTFVGVLALLGAAAAAITTSEPLPDIKPGYLDRPFGAWPLWLLLAVVALASARGTNPFRQHTVTLFTAELVVLAAAAFVAYSPAAINIGSQESHRAIASTFSSLSFLALLVLQAAAVARIAVRPSVSTVAT